MILLNNNYYSGFYERSIIEGIDIDNLVSRISFSEEYLRKPYIIDGYPCPYEDETGKIFLDGSCNVFAKTLRFFFNNYQVYMVSQPPHQHWYCKTVFNNRNLFVDIRGATTDYSAFSTRYPFINDSHNLKLQLMEGKDLLFYEENWRRTAEVFAFNIICEHKSYYGDFI